MQKQSSTPSNESIKGLEIEGESWMQDAQFQKSAKEPASRRLICFKEGGVDSQARHRARMHASQELGSLTAVNDPHSRIIGGA
jgi:hypothetical protein